MKRLLVVLALVLSACAGDDCGSCSAGHSYCRDPGGNGADLCCPSNSPYYCKADNGCHPDPLFSCATGKVFCSTEYTCP